MYELAVTSCCGHEMHVSRFRMAKGLMNETASKNFYTNNLYYTMLLTVPFMILVIPRGNINVAILFIFNSSYMRQAGKSSLLHSTRVVTKINGHEDKQSSNLSNLNSVNNKLAQTK